MKKFCKILFLSSFFFSILLIQSNVKANSEDKRKNDKEKASQLASQLTNKDWNIRFKAILELKKMGPKAASTAPKLIEVLANLKRRDKQAYYLAGDIRETLIEFGEKALPDLIEGLGHKNALVRYTLKKVIPRIAEKGGKVVPLLLRFLKRNPHKKEHKIEVIDTLGRLGEKAEKAVPIITELLESKDSETRKIAIYALGNIGADSKTAVPTLIKILKNSKQDTQISVISALAEIGQSAKPAAPYLVKLFKNRNNDRMEVEILDALNKMQVENKQVLSVFLEALKSPSWRIRLFSVEALENMKKYSKEITPHLTKLLNDKEPIVRKKVKKVLQHLEEK